MQSTEEKMRKTHRLSVTEAAEALKTFTNSIESLVLATVDENAEPFASYAPFVEDEEHNYYVVVSSYVRHAHNMVTTRKASLLFLEDESKTANIFARKRLYFKAKVQKFARDDKRAQKINNLFGEKFGNKAKMVIEMEDFRIYKLLPYEGSIVLGFGSAFSVSEDRKTLTPKNALHQEEHEKNL